MNQASIKLPLAGALVALAAALGFGAAHWADARKAAVATTAPVPVPAPALPAPAQSNDEISIPAEYIQLAQIAVEPVGNGGIGGEILSVGSVTASPNHAAVIVARAAGTIARLHRQLGDSVRAGELLATVDSPEAAGLAADRNAAAARLEQARSAYAREAALFEQGVTPRQDMEAAKAALGVADSEARRATAVARAAQVAPDGRSVAVVSPIAGRISALAGTLGAYVQPQTELFHITGAGPRQIEVPLPAAEMARVHSGDRATVSAADGTPVAATVRAVTSSVNGATRTATAILITDAALVAGEGVQVRLHLKGGRPGLVVPEEAVQNLDGRAVLFVRTPQGFRPQPVLVGERSGGSALIVSGVRAGELVATRNAFLVKADTIKSAKEE